MNVEALAIERIANVAWIAELYRLSTIAAASGDAQESLLSMLTHIVEGFGAVSGSLALVSEKDTAALQLVAGIDLPAHMIGRRIGFGEGVLGKVALAGKSLLLHGETGKTPGMERSRARGSSMCWPLVVQERVVGTLAVNRAVEQPPYTKEDLEHGEIMATFVALVVDNSAAHRESQRRIDALSQMNAELSAAHQKIKEAQAQLLHSEKMASIGQLAAGVAHEINNPVGYVYSNVNSLARYVDDLLRVIDAYAAAVPAPSAALTRTIADADLPFLREDVITLLSESREGLERVRGIVQNLKDFSRVDAGDEWLMADITDGLRSTLNIVHNELRYCAEVTCEFTPLPQIECLPSQLNQVFMNLLVNAGQAMREKGTIRIATGHDVGAAEVWVAISDNGSGIPPEIQSRIFEPFFTTKPIGKGTGLGLSLSYSIVQKHKGRIEVQSTLGSGTTFRVTLPTRRLKNEPVDKR